MKILPSALFAALAIAGPGASFAQSDRPQDFDRAELYLSNCAPCHGRTGLGGGPVAAALKDPVPVLATLAKRHGGAFPAEYVYRIIDGREMRRAHGTRVMPIWGTQLLLRHKGQGAESSTRLLIDALIEHIRTLQIE